MNYSSLSSQELSLMKDQYVDVIFPLDRNQRYFMFKEMAQTYSFLWIEKKDQMLLSYYKKQAAVLMLGWGGVAYYFSSLLASNPQKFY